MLQELISSRDFAELLAYEQMQPHGEERADLRTGILASVLANSFRVKSSSPLKPKDFMPEFDNFVAPLASGELSRRLQLFTAMSGGTLKRG